MKDGRTLSLEDDRSQVLSVATDKMKAKFQKLASDFLGAKRVADIIDLVMNLEKVKRITELTNKLSNK